MARQPMWMLLTLMACGGETAPPADGAEQAPAAEAPAAEAAPAPPEFKLDTSTMKSNAEEIALVPSPAEMQRALKNLGLQTSLADSVAYRDIKMDTDNRDQLAVRTGVVLADLLLTVQSAQKEMLLNRLNRLRDGMGKLNAGEDILSVIDRLITKVTNDAISREDLVKEMDQLSGIMVPEIRQEAGEEVVPLIQAGAWLEGAHLVSGAIQKEKKFEHATDLLRQPVVVRYFIKYVKREGREKAPDEVVSQLEKTLETLKEICDKDTMTEQDISTIHTTTGAVLKLL